MSSEQGRLRSPAASGAVAREASQIPPITAILNSFTSFATLILNQTPCAKVPTLTFYK
jgi:hypothetical protein